MDTKNRKKRQKKFDDRIYTEGFPCHKFILKSLSTINEAKVFTKCYVTTMRSVGMSDSDIETSLIFFPGIAQELAGRYDFTSWDNGIAGMSLVDNVLFDKEVATYKTCRQYYKKTDTRCTACALCPIASQYKNKNQDAERNIILYALVSKENLEYVKAKGITVEMFSSVTDVTAYKASSLKPSLYPFYKNTYTALLDEDIYKDIYTFEIDYEPVLEKYHTKRISRMSSIEKNCSFSVNTFCTVMMNEMLSGEACTQSEVDSYIAILHPDKAATLADVLIENTPSKKSHVIAKNSNLGASQLDRFYTSEQPKDVEVVSGSSDFPSDAFVSIDLDKVMTSFFSMESETDSVSEKELLKEENITCGPEPSFDETKDVIEEMAESELVTPANTKEDVIVDKEVDILESTEELGAGVKAEDVIAEVTDTDCYQDEPQTLPTTEVNADDADASDEKLYPVKLLDKSEKLLKISPSDMPGIPIISKLELQYFALNLDSGNSLLLSLFESHVYKDKKLSLELICTDDCSYYLLLYCPHIHGYFYTKCDAMVMEVLRPLLSHRSIMKFCYYPYALVSVLHKMGIVVKGLESLFTMSFFRLGSHRLDMDAALEEMGAFKAEGGVTVRPVGNIQSLPILYMHCYHNVYYRNRRYFLKKGIMNEYELFNAFDTVLAMSYYQNRYSNEDGVLFTLPYAGGYKFYNTSPTSFKSPGKRFCLVLRRMPEDGRVVIMNLLCDMMEKGLFHNTGIMLLSLGNNYISFYVKDKDADYVETRINRLLLSYLSRTGRRGMEYYIQELSGEAVCFDSVL